MTQTELYQSVLSRLANVPASYLQEIDRYLEKLENDASTKPSPMDIEGIMALAGSWEDMSEEEFSDFLHNTAETRKELFSRQIDL